MPRSHMEGVAIHSGHQIPIVGLQYPIRQRIIHHMAYLGTYKDVLVRLVTLILLTDNPLGQAASSRLMRLC
jgi:hypothetical protein